jgi:hypothetical protein
MIFDKTTIFFEIISRQQTFEFYSSHFLLVNLLNSVSVILIFAVCYYEYCKENPARQHQ